MVITLRQVQNMQRKGAADAKSGVDFTLPESAYDPASAMNAAYAKGYASIRPIRRAIGVVERYENNYVRPTIGVGGKKYYA